MFVFFFLKKEKEVSPPQAEGTWAEPAFCVCPLQLGTGVSAELELREHVLRERSGRHLRAALLN